MSDERPRAGLVVARSILISFAYIVIGTGVYIYFIRTAIGQQLDASSFGAVMWLRDYLGAWVERLRIILLAASGALFLLLLVIALMRKRWRDSIVAVAICVITLLASTVLKDAVVFRPDLGDFGYPYNTFPSDHEAITVAAMIGAYLLLSDRLRRPVFILPLLVIGVASGLFQVASYAHRPSDVFAGALLAGGVAALFFEFRSALSAPWRWVLWVFIGLTGLFGALCLASWQLSGYATEQQETATLGIALCSAATVAAAIVIGAEGRPWGAPHRFDTVSAGSPEPSAQSGQRTARGKARRP